MRYFRQCLFWIIFSSLVWGVDYDCTALQIETACLATDPESGQKIKQCKWTDNKCVADCSEIGEEWCTENGCNRVDTINCYDDAALLLVDCSSFLKRAQCLNKSIDDARPNHCYWRSSGSNFADIDVGECVTVDSCISARNADECEIFKNTYHQPCYYFPKEENSICENVTDCTALDTEELCTRHGVPNVFCSWNTAADKCESADTKSCQTSGAKDHASCFVANKYLPSGTKCFYKNDVDLCEPLSVKLECSKLNLEECETLSFDYVGISCKVQSSECVPVVRCDDTTEYTTELECASNYSETNQCFYLSSLPPNGTKKACVFRKDVTCAKLSTQSKCIFHGIDGLYCHWASGTCTDQDSCEAKSKKDCVADNNCFFALDVDSFFRDDVSIKYEQGTGHCYTKSLNYPREDCAKFVNPNQCNSQTSPDDKDETGATNIQHCLYSVCGSGGQAKCEGKCIPWSMTVVPGNNKGLANRSDCEGITEPSQCQVPIIYGDTTLYLCSYIDNHCSGCQAPLTGSDEETFKLPCKCRYGVDKSIVDAETCADGVTSNSASFSYEGDKCTGLSKGDCIDSVCVWFNNSECRLLSSCSCEMFTNNVDINKDNCNSQAGLNCKAYPIYFEPGYQESVDWRCKKEVTCDSKDLESPTLCNGAGSGDGQTCFWLEKFNELGGVCVNPSTAGGGKVIECTNFTASQCPVTDEQLLPFIGAKRVCMIDSTTGNCVDSNYLSIPNYCAQFKYGSHNSDDTNYTKCLEEKMCVPTDLEGDEGVCLPDSAVAPECEMFGEENCRYFNATGDDGSQGNKKKKNQNKNCEYLSLNGSDKKCVDGNFVQCGDLSTTDCEGGLRAQTNKCINDGGTCKISRCLSATSEAVCDRAQNKGCFWNAGKCVKKTCEKYSSTDCPEHCFTQSSNCASYQNCAGVADIVNCTTALPADGSRCYVDAANKCTKVEAKVCADAKTPNECDNTKPSDGYGCKWTTPTETTPESKCELKDPPTCQGISATDGTECVPEGRLFAFFSEWCDYNGNGCQPNCEAIENNEDCLREEKYCDQFKGNQCKNRYFVSVENSDCAISGKAECKGHCRWIDDEAGCEAIPVEENSSKSLNRAVIIGSVVGGVVILLLIAGVIIVILLYIRMKKKHEEEEARLQREADAEAAAEGDEGDLGSGGGGGGGEENKNTTMNANPDENVDADAGASSSSSGNDNELGDE